MGARSVPTDGTSLVIDPPEARSRVRQLVDFEGSLELDVSLAVGAVLLWLAAGIVASDVLESVAHVAIVGLIVLFPRAGILAVIPLLPFSNGGLFPPHGPLVAEAVAIGISIALRAARGGISVPLTARAAVWLALAFLVATLFQATLGGMNRAGGLPRSVLTDLDEVVIIVMTFVGTAVFLRPKGVVPAMVAYLVSYVVVAAVGIVHFTRPSVLRDLHLSWMVSTDATRFRASGVIPNSNFLGLFLAIGLAWLVIVIVWYAWRGRLLPVVAALLAGPIASVALALTYSRAAILATAFGVVVATAQYSRRAAAAMLVAGALVAVLAYPLFLNFRLSQTFGSDSAAAQQAQETSDSLRANQAVAAVRAFLDAPILGHGFGRFGTVSPRYTGQSVLTSAHNTYLKLAAEQGVVGLGLFMAFLFAIAVPLWRARVGPWSAGLAVVGVIAIFSLTGDAMAGSRAIASGFVVIAAMLVAADGGRDPLAATASGAVNAPREDE